MAITRLNHAVLYVVDADRSAAFYTEVLGFRRLPLEAPGAVFLQAPGSTNDHDLGLFSIGEAGARPPGRRATVGLYHLAWEVDTLDELERLAGALAAEHALVGATDHGTTKSLYARDPDGIEFEVAWVVPAELLDDEAREAGAHLRPLDMAMVKQRYGATTPGGVGVSIPAHI